MNKTEAERQVLFAERIALSRKRLDQAAKDIYREIKQALDELEQLERALRGERS